MKKIYTLVLFLITFFNGNAQIVDIPDANFKAKLLAASPDNSIAKNADGQYIKIDINNDGEIQENEALSVFQLDVSNSDIQNLVGIEAFLNLTGLLCDNNQLTSLDVSQNVALQYINCSYNDLTSLDVSQNVALQYINCSDNWLINLDFSQNISLRDIRCDYNQLTSLDVSQNVVLEYLQCYTNQLTSLDVSQSVALQYINCRENELISLDFSQNIALRELFCDDNQLTSLNVTQNVVLEYLQCFTNQLTSLDVTQNIALRELICYDNQLTSLNVTQNVVLEYLHCFTNQLTSLDVTQNIALRELFCDGNQLTSLDVSQNVTLRELFCGDNQLTSLNVTQNTALTSLACGGNQLTSIDVSQNIALRSLGCESNLITNLDFSQNVALEDIYCNNNQLTSLDFSQNIALRDLYCSNNLLTSLDVTQNVALGFLFCYNNQLTSLDVTQNVALEFLICYNNQLTSLDFSQNTALRDLYCGSNQLISLFIKNNYNYYWDILDFDQNPNLVYVCVSENNLDLVQQKIIDYGYTNCHVNTYCSFVPGGIFYTIQGNTKYDSNNNGCDDLDINYPNLNFTISNGLESGSFISNTSGNYFVPFEAGSYSITPVLENPSYFNVSPSSITISFPTETSPYNEDFCLTANGIFNDLEITILPIDVARPGFDVEYKVIYKNKGNQVTNGSITFNFNDSLMDLVSSIPSIDGSGMNSLNWNFMNLNPLETREINLIFNINTPMENPPVNAGDDLGFDALILPIQNDEIPADNISQIKVTVVNSYDPNDKTCLEGNTISPNMVGEYVHYIIRFENTGTFAAQNVVIADVIDTTKFEISSLVPQSSSHDFITRINGNKVEFIFENINLPFDDENNDGYVAFKIKTKPNLVVGDEFTNTASIYFDYNFPIITNTTSTTVTALSNQDFDFETNFALYPNPAKEVLNIKTKTEMDVKSISIYNTLGQIIMTTIQAEKGEINVSNLQSGSYFIKVFTDKGSSTAKFIKQ